MVGLNTLEAVLVVRVQPRATYLSFRLQVSIVEHYAEYHVAGLLLGKVAVLHIEGYAARHVVIGVGLGPEHLLAALGIGAAPVYGVGQGG